MKKAAKLLLWVGILAAVATSAFAETRTVSWNPVTTYTDNTLFAPKTVAYTVYWTTDPALSPASLRTIGSSLSTISATFDPTVQGMTRGGTVYFTAKAVLNTGEESSLSPSFAWVVPVVTLPPPPPPPAVLTGVMVSGPSSVNEGGTGSYTATGTWDNGTTAAITPTWSENSAYATIGSGGLLTAATVTANQAVTVTATYGGRTGTRSVTIVNGTATLAGIAISGLSSVNEGGTATYTATATWSDTTTTSVTPTWSTNLGTISAAGLFTTPSVTANQTATVTASYTSGGVTRTATRDVTVVNGTATLTGIAISGLSSVNEGGTATYTATGTWDNGTTAAVTPTWSENSAYATIGSGGLLTAGTVTANQAVTVTAAYGGRTGTISVTIADVPGGAPAAPKNIGIAGPTSSGPNDIYRMNWDSVTTTWDGAPLELGRTVRYTAYWTDDPALSAASLRTLGSLISGTTLDFDPSANQMAKNQVVYLTVRTTLDTGDPSSLAASLTWRVSNTGPVPPAKGKIIKK